MNCACLLHISWIWDQPVFQKTWHKRLSATFQIITLRLGRTTKSKNQLIKMALPISFANAHSFKWNLKLFNINYDIHELSS